MSARDPGDWRSIVADGLVSDAMALFRDNRLWISGAIDRSCESPIEKLLAATFAGISELGPAPRRPILDFPARSTTIDHLRDWFLHFTLRDAFSGTFCLKMEDTWIAIIRPQVEVGPFRVDFAVVATAIGWRCPDLESFPILKVAIECDGHDFHERTKEQAARDRARDRFLQGEGLDVLRFTGSEIWKSPEGCRAEIIGHIDRWAAPILEAYRQEEKQKAEAANA